MPKMGSLEKPHSVPEECISKKIKFSSGEKKLGNEINGIFSGKKKRKNPQEKQTGKQKEDNDSKPKGVEKKLNSGEKKFGNEIDEIFSSKKKRKSPQEEQTEKQKEDTNSKPKHVKKKKGKVHEKVEFVDPPSKPRKRTGDGLVLYTEEELGIGKSDAGNTRLCPFDCSCCF